MSQKNSREAKAERRFWRKLKQASDEWNRPIIKIIEGKAYKGVRPYRDFTEEYKQGLLYVKEVKKDLEIKPSIYKLAEKIAEVKESKILINLNHGPTNIDELARANQTNPRGDSIDRDNHTRSRDHHQGDALHHSH